jgi:hypothetical protein
MRRRLACPITESARGVHERPLTQTIRVGSADEVPVGYRRIQLHSPAIFAKVQVLSSRYGRPIFMETKESPSNQRSAYWAHADVIPGLARWLRFRVFSLSDLTDLSEG